MVMKEIQHLLRRGSDVKELIGAGFARSSVYRVKRQLDKLAQNKNQKMIRSAHVANDSNMAPAKNFESEAKQFRTWLRLLQVSNALQRLINEALVDAPISSQEFLVLALLINNPNRLKQKDISRRLRRPENSISACITKMEKKGLLKRVLDNIDRRAYTIRLTPDGASRLYEVSTAVSSVISHAFRQVTEGQRLNLESTLQKVVGTDLEAWENR